MSANALSVRSVLEEMLFVIAGSMSTPARATSKCEMDEPDAYVVGEYMSGRLAASPPATFAGSETSVAAPVRDLRCSRLPSASVMRTDGIRSRRPRRPCRRADSPHRVRDDDADRAGVLRVLHLTGTHAARSMNAILPERLFVMVCSRSSDCRSCP